MKIAVVILNWNGEKLLAQFLPSIVEHSRGIARVYVADNKSTDNSVAFVRENFKEVSIVENKAAKQNRSERSVTTPDMIDCLGEAFHLVFEATDDVFTKSFKLY